MINPPLTRTRAAPRPPRREDRHDLYCLLHQKPFPSIPCCRSVLSRQQIYKHFSETCRARQGPPIRCSARFVPHVAHESVTEHSLLSMCSARTADPNHDCVFGATSIFPKLVGLARGRQSDDLHVLSRMLHTKVLLSIPCWRSVLPGQQI